MCIGWEGCFRSVLQHGTDFGLNFRLPQSGPIGSCFPSQDPVLQLEHESGALDAQLATEFQQSMALDGAPFDMTAVQKKAYKTKAALWCKSDPLPRVLLLMRVMAIVRRLQHAFFYLGSEAFNRAQDLRAAKGERKSCKVQHVAMGHHVQAAIAGVCQELERSPAPFPIANQNLSNRSLAFRLLSHCGCSVHHLMRSVHLQHPYKLFLLLETLGTTMDGLLQMAAEDPPCRRDELADDFLTRWASRASVPGADREQLQEVRRAACAELESAAAIIEIDIAATEARHAMNRRASVLKSLQTWTAALHYLSASWVVRQAARARTTTQKPEPKRLGRPPKAKAVQEGKKRSGGGGGPYRAFLHINFAGVRGGRATWSAAAEAYRQLSDEERRYYQEIGKLGTAAWRQNPHGRRGVAFGRPLPARSSKQLPSLPNIVRSDGVVVAADQPRPQALVPLPQLACTFSQGMKALTRQQRAEARAMTIRAQEEEELIHRHSQAVLATMEDPFPAVRAADHFAQACKGFCAVQTTNVEIQPPSVEFSAASCWH